jgi:hypothetical protein
MLFLLSSLLLYDECRSGSTVQLSKTPTISRRQYSFTSPNSVFCLNATVPNIAISFLQKVNASYQIYRTVNPTGTLVFNSTFGEDPLSVVEFGDDTGLIIIRCASVSELIYTAIAWPDDCVSRIVSNRESDFFSVDDQCEHDGCVEPGATICYFNSLQSEALYAIDVDLRHEASLVEVFSAPERPVRNFKGKEEYSLNVGPESDPVYFTVFNGNDEHILTKRVSITTNSFGISDGVRAYYAHDPPGIALFYQDAEGDQGAPIGAFFTMAAIMVLSIVLAAYAYLFLQQSPPVRERSVIRRPDAGQGDGEEVDRKHYTHVLHGGDVDADGLILDDIP